MDNQPGFAEFRSGLNWEIINDKIFAMKIVQNEPYKLLFASFSNWHSFFTKRLFFPQPHKAFPYLPDQFRNAYVFSYSILYRPLLIVLIILSIFTLYQKKLLNLLFSTVPILLYASLTVALLSAHGGEFIRYRVWVEYMILFFCLIPIGFFIEYLINYLAFK